MGDSSGFFFYLQLGFDHISDLAAYDHILFVVALCAMYRPKEWKIIAILVTAFTLGHSIALAASVLEVVSVSIAWVEFLIPVTVLLTCLYNVITFQYERMNSAKKSTVATNEEQHTRIAHYLPKYFLAVSFGLIHGLGFSNYLRYMLAEQESLLLPLVSFNIGLELGQLLIVGIILLLAGFFLDVLKVKQRDWNLFVSGAAFGIAFVLAIETAAALGTG